MQNVAKQVHYNADQHLWPVIVAPSQSTDKGALSMIEPQNFLWPFIPVRMSRVRWRQNPTHTITSDIRRDRLGEQLLDVSYQGIGKHFISIQIKHPVVRTQAGGISLLARKAFPFPINHSGTRGLCQLTGSVCATRINNDDFISPVLHLLKRFRQPLD